MRGGVTSAQPGRDIAGSFPLPETSQEWYIAVSRALEGEGYHETELAGWSSWPSTEQSRADQLLVVRELVAGRRTARTVLKNPRVAGC